MKIYISVIILFIGLTVNGQKPNQQEIIVKTKKEAKLRQYPETYEPVIMIIEEGEEVLITGFSENETFYKACYMDKCGYINKELIIRSKDFLIWSELLKADIEEQKGINDEAKYQERLKAYKSKQDSLIKKYGQATYDKLKDNKIWLGMTTDQCRLSWGEPSIINRDVGNYGVHEQWIYRKYDTYLYFENGKLTSWQD